jgi:hypothetical protein
MHFQQVFRMRDMAGQHFFGVVMEQDNMVVRPAASLQT